MIHRLAKFEVKDKDLDSAIKYITEFVDNVNGHEDDCLLYRSLQEKDNPTKFTHYMIFRTSQAEEIHKNTQWVNDFVSKLYPILKVETIFTEMKVIGSG